jgi:uroporphyrinogen-III synthase
MRVLVTRPDPDASETASHLVARGHVALLAPLLKIEYVDGDWLELEGTAAILATSANGVRALVRRTQRRDVLLFAVGQQTAALARESGFRAVKSADGDAAALSALVSRTLRPADGVLVHAAGAEAAGKLAHDLTSAGFDVRSLVLYHAKAATNLPPKARGAIESGSLDAVLHFSYRSARVFREVVVAAGLQDACRALLMVCISAATARSLEGFPCRELRIAAAPNQEALLACLA